MATDKLGIFLLHLIRNYYKEIHNFEVSGTSGTFKINTTAILDFIVQDDDNLILSFDGLMQRYMNFMRAK